MKSVIRFFVERHLFSYILSISVLLLGVSTMLTIPRDNLPYVELQKLNIQTAYPGASPEDVALNVTSKIEDELRDVDGIEKITSLSMENYSSVRIVLDPSFDDLDGAKRDVRDAINRIHDFPIEVEESPEIFEIKTSEIPIIEVGVSLSITEKKSEQATLSGDSYERLRAAAKRLEKRILKIPGVTSVSTYGDYDREIRIELDAAKLEKLQISAREVANAIRQRNHRGSAGTFETYVDQTRIVTLAEFSDPSSVEDVIVRTGFNTPSVRVSDVATVVDSHEEPDVISRVNGRSSISFLIKKKRSADIIRTVDHVRELVTELADADEKFDYLISGDTSRVVRNRLQVVADNGIMGLLFVALMLLLFLDKRSAFWVSMGLPVSLFGALFFLPLFGVTLDSIGLSAMAIVVGIVVDDAIVVSENIARHRAMGKSAIDAAVDGAHEVFLPVLTTIITTMLAFSPMFFMDGTMGDFVFVIPLVVVLALLISFIESAFILPAHLAHGKKSTNDRIGFFTRVLIPQFERFTRGVLTARYFVVVIFISCLSTSLWYAKTYMSFEVFPTQAGDEFHIQIALPSGASLQATSEKVREIEHLVKTLPSGELASYVTRIGINRSALDGKNDHWAKITVYLTPYGKRGRVIDDIVTGLRQSANQLTGYQTVVFNIETGGPPLGRPVQVRVVGVDDHERDQLAKRIVEELKHIQGVNDIDRDDKQGKQQISIELNYDQLARLGLNVENVSQALRLTYDGEIVTHVRYQDEDVGFRVVYAEDYRARVNALSALLIPNKQGRLIQLGTVANFKKSPGPANVRHYDREKSITVTADITKGVVTASQVAEHLDKSLKDTLSSGEYPKTQVIYGGEAEESQDSMQSLMIAFVAAVIGIYFVLVLLFNSLLQPLWVLLVVPFGLMGVIAAFAMHNQTLGFVAMNGVIGLIGVLVNDSLILMNTLNQLKSKNKGKVDKELLIKTTGLRLRAISITSITTAAGLLPMVYGIGGVDAFMAPMAMAMGYGILLATPITLMLLPCLLMIQQDVSMLFTHKDNKQL